MHAVFDTYFQGLVWSKVICTVPISLAQNLFIVLNILNNHWNGVAPKILNLPTGNFTGVGAGNCIVLNKTPCQTAPCELSSPRGKSCHRWVVVNGVVSSYTEYLALQLAVFLLMSLLCQKIKKKN